MTSPSPPRPFVTNSSELLFGNSVSIRSAKSFPKPDSDFLGICSRWPWKSCTMQGAAHTLKRVAAKMCQEGTVPGAAPYLHLPRIFGFLKVTWMYLVSAGSFNRWDYKRILWSLLVSLHEMTHIVDCKSLTMFTHHVFFFLGYMLDNIMAAMINGCRLAREIWQMEKNNEQKNKFTQFSGHWLKLNLADTSLSLSTITNKGSLQQWRCPWHRPHHHFRDNSDCLLHLWLKNQPDFSHFLGSLIMLSLCVSRLLGAGLHWLYNWPCLPLMMIITMAKAQTGWFWCGREC